MFLLEFCIIILKLLLRVKSSSYLLINSSLWKADADLSVPSHQTKDRASQPYAQAGEKTFQPGSVKVVMAGSGCENREKVEQVQLLSCLTDISV
jgi:hypothetical protein